MNKLIGLCLGVLLLASACNSLQKHDGYIIKGKVAGLEQGWVKLIKQNIVDRFAPKLVIDSALIVNGTFELKGKIKYPDQVMLTVGKGYNANIMLENCSMELNLDVTKIEQGRIFTELKGSELYDLLTKQLQKEDSLYNQKKYDVLKKMRDEGAMAYGSRDEARIKAHQENFAKLETLAMEQFNERLNSKLQFVKDNPNSAVAPYVLSFMFSEARMTKEQLKEYYSIFQGDAKHTAMYQFYKKTYDEIFEKLAIGATAPDFTLPTSKGGTLSLSEVKGKYIFVDFWASWCGPCRAAFPHLKEVYAKYHKDGFEVIAIGTADSGNKWLKAIEKDQTVWNHVFDGDPKLKIKGKGAYGEVAKAYAVPFLPTTFLLDENGKILGRQLRGEALDKKMEELYGY